MKILSLVLCLALVGAPLMSFAADPAQSDALGFTMKSISGDEVDLAKFKGKVLLVVNVASACGLTPHYEGMESLYEKYSDQGLTVLGFPCNQFGKQEPGTDAEIAEFCTGTYKVKFPMFSKIDVNGAKQAPLYKLLTSVDTKPKGAGDITWNFEKFVIGRDGKVVARFAPKTSPTDPELVKVIEAELAKK